MSHISTSSTCGRRGDANAHRNNRYRRRGRDGPDLVGRRNVPVGPRAQRGNEVDRGYPALTPPESNRRTARNRPTRLTGALFVPPPNRQPRQTCQQAELSQLRAFSFQPSSHPTETDPGSLLGTCSCSATEITRAKTQNHRVRQLYRNDRPVQRPEPTHALWFAALFVDSPHRPLASVDHAAHPPLRFRARCRG